MAKAKKTRIRLAINETDPVPLVKDFDTFVNYLAENKPYLKEPRGNYLSKRIRRKEIPYLSHSRRFFYALSILLWFFPVNS